MSAINNLKKLVTTLLVPPQLKDAGAAAGNTYVDTQGASEVRFLIAVGAIDTTLGSGDATTAPLIEECDTTGGAYTPVTGAALADVVAATEDNLLFAIHVDLRKTHKRYLRIKAPTSGDGVLGTNLCAIAEMGMLDAEPANAAGQGLTEFIEA